MNVGNLLTINNRIYSWHYVTINLNVEIESNAPYDHHVSHHKRSGILSSWDHFFELTDLHISVTGTGRKFGQCWSTYWCVLRREFSGMIHWLSINNHPSNPQQPIHSLRLAPVSLSHQIKTNIAIENGPIEIVDLPINSMVIFQLLPRIIPSHSPSSSPFGTAQSQRRFERFVDDRPSAESTCHQCLLRQLASCWVMWWFSENFHRKNMILHANVYQRV